MRFKLSQDIESNVLMRTRDREGHIVDQVESHNIVVNLGRTYLRDSMAISQYPILSSTPPPSTPSVSGIVRRSEELIRYVALGVGGQLQTATYPGRGTFTEVVTVRGLERPVPVTYRADPTLVGVGLAADDYWQWVKQVEPQDSADELPDDFSVIYRAVFGYNEVSFSGQIGDYGTSVPISEILLLTSEAQAYSRAPMASATYTVTHADLSAYLWPPTSSSSFPGYGGDVGGAVAYNLTTPIYKTPGVTLEILWELRS